MFNLRSEEDFRSIPRLRLQKDSDGTYIAKSINARFSKDHLYFQGPGILGIYYERDTEMSATRSRKAWERKCRNVVPGGMEGDFDGTIYFHPVTEKDIPAEFFKQELHGILRGLDAALPAEDVNEGSEAFIDS